MKKTKYKSNKKRFKIITFWHQNKLFGIPKREISEIQESRKINLKLKFLPEIKGVVDRGKKEFTIINFDVLLGFDESKSQINKTILFNPNSSSYYGIQVERVSGDLQIEASKLVSPDSFGSKFAGLSKNIISSVYPMRYFPLYMIDLKQYFRN